MAADHSPDPQSAAGSPGLWRDRDFLGLWAGQSVSLIGDQVTLLALPLSAVVLLHAGSFQMGVLGAAQSAPFLLFGLVAGIWIDRVRRRPLLIGADCGRALCLAAIPAAFWLGVLSLPYLFVMAFVIGVLSVVFNLSYQAFLPSLVRTDQLADANSRLEASRSTSQVVGPSLAGLLVQFTTPAAALLADGLSFVVSVLSILGIRRPEPPPQRSEAGSIRAELGEGFRFIWNHQHLRPIMIVSGVSNVFLSMVAAIFVLYANRGLGVSPGLLGLITAVGGLGGVAGAILVRPTVARIGFGAMIICSIAACTLATFAIALAGALPVPAAATLLVARAITFYALSSYNVSQFTLWQSTTPAHLQGRVVASIHVVIWGTVPVGSLIAGLLGSATSLPLTMAIAGFGLLATLVVAVLSPLRSARQQPTEAALAGQQ